MAEKLSMDAETWGAIQKSQEMHRGIDVGVEDTLAQISAMTADSNFTEDADEAGVNGDVRQPINEALDVIHLSKNPTFQQIYSALREKVSSWTVKSKSEKATADVRSFNHDKEIAGEELLAIIGAILGDAQKRVEEMTTEEAYLVGITDRKEFAKSLAKGEPSKRPATLDADGNDPRKKRAFLKSLAEKKGEERLGSKLTSLNAGHIPQESETRQENQ